MEHDAKSKHGCLQVSPCLHDQVAIDYARRIAPRVQWALIPPPVTEYTQMIERMQQKMMEAFGIKLLVSPAAAPDRVIAMVNGELVGMIADIAPNGE